MRVSFFNESIILNLTIHKPIVKRLYRLAMLDGFALLALVMIAVPLKRWADFPWAVKVLGPVHGALFLALTLTLVVAVSQQAIRKRLGALILVLAFIPLGAFYADYLLKKSQQTEDLQ